MSGLIDTDQLKALLEANGGGAIEGKIINVVHHLPFVCSLTQPEPDQLEARLSRRQSIGLDAAPISQLARRRSSVMWPHMMGESGTWKLKHRPGYSALYAGIRSLAKNYRTLYVGSTGNIQTEPNKERVLTEQVTPEERENLTRLLRTKHKMVPIFIEEALGFGHYEGYCKQILWPILHYLTWGESLDEKKFWEAYVAVNQIFADEVAKHYQDGDLIIVHDYHLMLVPQMLRERLPQGARIGLFVHTPFVSSEILRCLPRRKNIILGMLHANLVGFQTYNYARHFISNCTRILGYEYTPTGVDANGVIVSIGIHPIGIDVDLTRQNCLHHGVQPKLDAILQKFKDKKIIVGRDKLDPVKGVLQKFESFEYFLEHYPEWRNKVVLIQVTSPGAIDSPRLEIKLSEIVTRINSKYGSLEFLPVQHFHQHIDRDEYYALLKAGDVMLITPTADGMNTTSLEFIVAQEQSKQSPLIISEFTGTARNLSSASIVNPYDYAQVAHAIKENLEMSPEEKLEKFQEMDAFVNHHTAEYWANALVKDIVASSAKTAGWVPTPRLEYDRLKIEYNNSRKRLMFFDYDGTLTPIVEKPEDAAPSEQTLRTLEKLCADPRNVVMVVSGRDQKALEGWLGHIPNLGLSFEHGCFIREPGRKQIIDMTSQIDMSWRDDVMEIFKYYTERTPGSFIETKRCALTWHYRSADPKFGALQARELQNHLEQSIISKVPAEILVGKMNLEVRPTTINKGEVIKRTMAMYSEANFVLCAGDDKTDEDMFRVLTRMAQRGIDSIVFTVTIGPADKRTLAAWHLESTNDFNDILERLSDQKQQ
ncbi:glycosyltransferase family 20-domain-containing protein [Dichotomocladium elegans]|nr:glycosyltransferase family 20-domain-containing protein [Dichotomocladium elegans]